MVEAVFEGENPLKAYHLYKTFDAYYVSAAKYRKLFDNGQILIIPKLLRWKRLIIRMVESADCSASCGDLAAVTWLRFLGCGVRLWIVR